MKASEFDKKFDDGENILTELDLARARRPEGETKRINFDFPARMLASLDREAHRLGVTRQSLLSRCGWRNVCNNDSNPSILGGIIQKEPSYLKILLQHYNNLPSAAYIKYTGINFARERRRHVGGEYSPLFGHFWLKRWQSSHIKTAKICFCRFCFIYLTNFSFGE